MNYQKHYDLLMEKARGRSKPAGYVERHHVLPRSMGGSDARSNLVYLSAREHFVAHYLFAKVHGGRQWNAVAMFRMNPNKSNKRYVNGRLYAAAKENNAKAKAGEMKGNRRAEGFKHSEEFKKLVSELFSGDKNHMKLPENRERMRGFKNPMKNPCVADKLRGENNGFFGKKHSDESLEKISESRKGKCVGSNNHKSRPIKCVESGIVYESVSKAVCFVKDKFPAASGAFINRQSKNNKQAYGYHWQYV